MLGTIRQVTRQLVGEQNYYAAGVYSDLIWSYLTRRRSLFLHSMGKVGSTTVASSLQAAGLEQDTAVYHTHFLTQAGTSFLQKLQTEGYGSWSKVPPRTRRHILRSRTLGRSLWLACPNGRKCLVVTLVRDPIATNISGFFHNYDWWPSELQMRCKSRSSGCLEGLVQCFLEAYPHTVPLTWFDLELKPLFGVDVFTSEFPSAKGYGEYEGAFADILLLKLEKLDQCGSEALGRFLGIRDFHLQEANVARDKWYSALYEEFKDFIVLPETYLDKMYLSKYTRHFYSQEEIDRFRSKWSRTKG